MSNANSNVSKLKLPDCINDVSSLDQHAILRIAQYK